MPSIAPARRQNTNAVFAILGLPLLELRFENGVKVATFHICAFFQIILRTLLIAETVLLYRLRHLHVTFLNHIAKHFFLPLESIIDQANADDVSKNGCQYKKPNMVCCHHCPLAALALDIRWRLAAY